jgi:hypothetical protein
LFENEKAKIPHNHSNGQSETQAENLATTPQIKTPNISSPQNFFNTQFFQNDNLIISGTLLKEKFKDEIKKEVEKLKTLLSENGFKLYLLISRFCNSRRDFKISRFFFSSRDLSFGLFLDRRL